MPSLIKHLIVSFLLTSVLYSQSEEWALYYLGDTHSSLIITAMVDDANGDLWVAVADWFSGPFISHIVFIEGDSLTTYEIPTKFPIMGLDVDQQNNLWIATQDTGLVKFDGSNFIYFNLSEINTSHPQFNNATCVKVDTENNIWVGAIPALLKYDGTNWTVYDENNSPLPYWPDIYDITLDWSGNLWFTGYEHIGKFDQANSWSLYNYGDQGYSIAVEEYDSVWVIGKWGRITRLYEDSLWYFDEITCSHSSTYSIAIDRSNVKWFTQQVDTGLLTYDGINISRIIPPFSEVTNESVTSIFIDKNNNKWLGFRNKYIVKYSGENILDVANNDFIALNDYKLRQNYPNPFNPSTKISYQIPEKGFVSLKVYDLLGNEIAILANEEKPAEQYQVEFDAENLSSGVYFYRMKVNDFITSKKMILLK